MTQPTPASTSSQPPRGLLAALDQPQRRALLGLGIRRAYRRGTAVFHERQEADAVFLVLEGHVKISRVSADGRETVIAFRGPGELVGELAVIDGRSRSAGATALDDASLVVIPASRFLGFLRREPHVAFVVMRDLSARMREVLARLFELSSYDATGRLALRLLELADSNGRVSEDGIHIELPITQEELAGSIGASREAVTKGLHALRELGCVQTARKEIVVLDVETLRDRGALSG